jgi:hypothetical protein
MSAAVAELDLLEETLGGLAPDDELTWQRLAGIAGELLLLTKLNLKVCAFSSTYHVYYVSTEISILVVFQNPALGALRNTYLLPAIQHQSPLVRQAAVRALGLYSLLSRAAAKENLILLMQPVHFCRSYLHRFEKRHRCFICF